MILFLVVSGCTGAAKKPQCTAGVAPVPVWVHHVENFDGYYVGVGQAEPTDGNFSLQMQLARRRALDQLVQNILVTVESSLELTEVQEETAGGDSRATRTATRRLRVASDLALKEVTNAGTYQDPATCTLWVRLKIRRELADNLIGLKQANSLYQLTLEENEATPAQKLRWITEAMARLDGVDFSMLPGEAGNKANLTALFSRRKTELEQDTSYRNIWLYTGPSILGAVLAKNLRALAETHGSVYIDTRCPSVNACLSLAREYRSHTLVRVKMTEEVSTGLLGMHKGTLELDVARFDVASGTRLARHSEKGGAFAYTEASIDWARLLQQLMGTESMKQVVE